ncbi:MAG TPA: acyl-CoA dehydrogenase family protein [Anaeromyxobacter sp.]
MTLHGHLDPAHALHPRAAFARLPAAVRALVAYDPAPLWEADTRLLPGPLRRYRRKVREFATRVLAPRALAADRQPHGKEEREVLLAAAREGHLTDLLPWPLGSLPWSRARYPLALAHCIKMEELCAACGGLGLLIGAHALGSIPLLLSGDVRAIRRFLLPAYRRTRAGEPQVFAFAITEPGAGSDVEESAGAALARPGTRARRVEGGFRLSGRKIFISGGDIAEHVTVFAALEDEGMLSWTCFLVSRGMPGFSVVRRELKMGQRASGAAELLFEDVFVPDGHVVGGLRRGWAINRATLNISRVPVAAIALGIARGAVEAAVEFARRSQPGVRPLVERQDVQLEIARLWTELAAMRALVWQSASRWTARQARASMAKVFCSDAAVRVCERAMALMTERGLLHENRAEKAFRDARLTQIYEGTNQINLLAVVEDQLEELAPRASRQPAA